MEKQFLIEKWTYHAKRVLLNRKIIEVRYLTDEEMNMMNWSKRPVAFFLDNGESCVIAMDDEGNDGGALFYGKNGVLPTLSHDLDYKTYNEAPYGQD